MSSPWRSLFSPFFSSLLSSTNRKFLISLKLSSVSYSFSTLSLFFASGTFLLSFFNFSLWLGGSCLYILFLVMRRTILQGRSMILCSTRCFPSASFYGFTLKAKFLLFIFFHILYYLSFLWFIFFLLFIFIWWTFPSQNDHIFQYMLFQTYFWYRLLKHSISLLIFKYWWQFLVCIMFF